jgi:peptidoglycan/xylan/chitin deacetylase (PgdA/CDA1 family)
VVANTRRVLDLLDRYETTATFFFVGWIAERISPDSGEAGKETQNRSPGPLLRKLLL